MLQMLLIPRLEPPQVVWGEEYSAFVRSAKERGLNIWVDLATLRNTYPLEFLMQFVDEPSMSFTTTTPVDGADYVHLDVGAERDDHIPINTHRADGSRSLRSVWPASTWRTFASGDRLTIVRPLADIEHRYFLAEAAQDHADAFITADLEFAHDCARRANPMSVHQALALVGLFLRSRNVATVARAKRSTETMDLWTQYFCVSRTMLHEGWRWWDACVHAGLRPGGEVVTARASGVHPRFERALRARDAVLQLSLAGPQTPVGELLYHFDALLLWLGGAFDGTAHVTDLALAMSSDPLNIGWLRSRWRSRLANASPTLHAATEAGTPVRAVMDLVATLRNTIHAEPVGAVTYRDGSRAEDVGLVAIPRDHDGRMQKAVAVLGGAALWGQVFPADSSLGSLWDPFRVVQVLVPFAAAALNFLMRETPVEDLPGVTPADLMSGIPDDGMFEPRLLEHLRLLFGFAA